MPEKPLHPELAAVLSEIELSFFRRSETDAPAAIETFDDLDDGYRPTGFWSRVLRTKRVATEPPVDFIDVEVEAETEDEEWQWQIALARARAASGT